MIRNLEAVVRQTAEFCGKTYSQEKIDELCEHLSFEAMRKNPMTNYQHITKITSLAVDEKFGNFNFMRKGKVGSYKEEMSAEYVERFEKFMKHPEFEKYGFHYKM